MTRPKKNKKQLEIEAENKKQLAIAAENKKQAELAAEKTKQDADAKAEQEAEADAKAKADLAKQQAETARQQAITEAKNILNSNDKSQWSTAVTQLKNLEPLDAEAMLLLSGGLYQMENYTEACQWFKKAKSAGNQKADKLVKIKEKCRL